MHTLGLHVGTRDCYTGFCWRFLALFLIAPIACCTSLLLLTAGAGTTKEQETKRVDKELAHIRKQFGDKSIDGYNMKKYVWKLLYMYMLGYDIEVSGHSTFARARR